MIPNRLSDLAAGAPLQHWLVLGPFIVRTPGHFEREYLYERERILEIDYLAGEGGETTVRPSVGKEHANFGLGLKQLAWKEYPRPNLEGLHIAGDLIYETVQRNAVIYAAALVDAESATPALFDCYHSGMKLWVNGKVICNEPYGLPKGIRVRMESKLVQLERGENLFLIKFRPGYIADGINFRVREARLAPLVSEPHLPIAFGRVRALPYFTGTVESPRQLVEATLINTSHVSLKVHVSLASDTLQAQDASETLCEPGRPTPVRLSLPTPRDMAGKPVRAVMRARVYGRELEAPVQYSAAEPPHRDGLALVLTSFHFDTTYHEEQRVYAMGAFDVVRQYCRFHRIDPHFRSTLSEIDYLKPYFDMFPEDRETLLKAFREGRSNPDVMYNQPNEQNCDGEALVRNFLYGQLFHGRVLGDICHCYGPGDVFGHPNQLSQIARKAGCIGVTWDKHIWNFPPFFRHLALDGSSLPHKRGEAEWEDVHAMGLSVKTIGIDQSPPTDWHRELLPEVRQATYRDLMEAIHKQSEEEGAHLPVTSRDMSLYHAATALSRTDLKIANRLGENVLLTAERFATIAGLLGAKYPEKALDKAWRQILCGQHHDSITGTHNEISYVDLMDSYREALELGTDVLHRSLDYLGRAINPGAEVEHPLVVFNPLAWMRSDVVHATVTFRGKSRPKSVVLRDPRGRTVPFEVRDIKRNKKGEIESATVTFVAENVPSLGYRAYAVVASDKLLPECKRSYGTVIENEFYRIEVDPQRGGGIVRLYDKEARREVISRETDPLGRARPVGNELVILEEVADRPETQHEFYTTGLKFFSSERPAEVEVERGPITTTIRARYILGDLCGVIQEITLVKGVKRVEFRTILLDYQGENNLFCVTFPTSLRGAAPIFEERFGVVTRNDSKHFLDFRTHRQIMFSDCAVYAANKWMEYGTNALLQMGRNKYPLGMVSLVTANARADIRVAEDLQRTLIRKGVTCTPWLDRGGPRWGSYLPHMDEDLLCTRFRISLGSGGKNAYTKKLLSRQRASARKAFESRLRKAGHAFLFVKDGELNDPTWPPLPVLVIEAKNLKQLEKAIGELLHGFSETAVIKLPGEIDATGEAHRVDNYGVAILNRGTYANSVERGGVICMMLAHTCRWYGGVNNFPEGYLVPENKNHVYRYALYPHAGSWREARTVQAGYAFNYPLLARETQPVAEAPLPPAHGFLEVRPANVILAAIKPYGNPIAAFERQSLCDASGGIMLRLYDTEGVDSDATVSFASGIRSAWSANLLEERDHDLALRDGTILLRVPAYSIETVGFVPGKLGRKMGRRALGAEAEPVQPVWVRSWEHDRESLPMGYEPVVCSISREVVEEEQGRLLRIKVNAVNDYTDASVCGAATLIVPEHWTVEPAEVPFELAPLGHAIAEVHVQRPEPEQRGQIKLRFEHDGQVFQDVLEIGGSFDLEMATENRGDEIVVTVRNPCSEPVEAEVALATPIEAWSSALVGDYALLDISPRSQGVGLAPKQTARLTFRVKPVEERNFERADSYWAVAKLMSNGRITLRRCDARRKRRTLDDEAWFDRYVKRTRRLYQWPK